MRCLRRRRSPERLVGACSHLEASLVPNFSVAMCPAKLRSCFYCGSLLGLRSLHVTSRWGRTSAARWFANTESPDLPSRVGYKQLKWSQKLPAVFGSRRWGLNPAAHTAAKFGCFVRTLSLATHCWVLLHQDYTDSRFPGKLGHFFSAKTPWNPSLQIISFHALHFFFFSSSSGVSYCSCFFSGGGEGEGEGKEVHPAIDTLDPGGTTSIIKTLSSPFERHISDSGL